MARILVTGGNGFIGSNLVKKLKKDNKVVVLDNLTSSRYKPLHGLYYDDVSRPYFNFHEKYDIIFHLASITDTTFEDSKIMYNQNVQGFKNILRIAERDNSKLIYASSAGVYGNLKTPMKENKTQPLNAYAGSKLYMDLLAEHFSKDLNIVGLRYFNVYGPKEKDKGKSASMIYQLYQQMKKGNSPRLFKYGNQKRDFIYIDDVITATIKAIDAPSGIYNIGTGKATSFNKIVRIINQNLKTNLKPIYIDNPYEKFYQNHTKAHTKKAKKLLKFKSEYSIKKGIKKYIGELGSLTQ